MKNGAYMGLLAAVVLAIGAYLAHRTLSVLTVEVWALGFGFVFGNLGWNSLTWLAGMQLAGKQVLNMAIALMGVQFVLGSIQIDGYVFLILGLMVAVQYFLGGLLAKQFGIHSSCGSMVGVGSSVCGASAIAAVSPFMDAENHETGVAVGVVNVLGSIGIALLPLMVIGLNLSDEQAGILIGGSLQAVGQAVASGYAVNEHVGELATLIKMSRVTLLIPTVLILAVYSGYRSPGKQIPLKKTSPPFLIAFLVLLLATNLFQIPAEALGSLKQVDKALLTLAMVGLGYQIEFRSLRIHGMKAVGLGALLFLLQIGVMLIVVFTMSVF